MRVRDAIRYKGGAVHEVDAGATVGEAARRMLDQRVRSLVVTDHGMVRGIVTTADLLGVLLESPGAADAGSVHHVMKSEPVTVDADAWLVEALEMFAEHHINHLIVVDEGRLVGVLTPADVLHRLTEHLSFLNEHLQHYIQGTSAAPAKRGPGVKRAAPSAADAGS